MGRYGRVSLQNSHLEPKLPFRYYGALYPTPSPCATVEPLRNGLYWRPEPTPAKVPVEPPPAVTPSAPRPEKGP